jgi:hypothetical protein
MLRTAAGMSEARLHCLRRERVGRRRHASGGRAGGRAGGDHVENVIVRDRLRDAHGLARGRQQLPIGDRAEILGRLDGHDDHTEEGRERGQREERSDDE